MIDLYNPAWDTLDSYGHSAAKYLRRLVESEGDFRENMDALAKELSYNLIFYNATAYALPHLAQLCQRLSVDEKIYLIARIGVAVAMEAYAPLPQDSEAWREFHEGLTPLAQEARELAAHHMDRVRALPRDRDWSLPQVFAVSALALLWSRKHAFIYLCCLLVPSKGLPLACSSCEWDDGDEEEYPFFKSDIMLGDLDEEGYWLQRLLAATGDQDLLRWLPYLYGTCTCPKCGASGLVWEWTDRALEEAEL